LPIVTQVLLFYLQDTYQQQAVIIRQHIPITQVHTQPPVYTELLTILLCTALHIIKTCMVPPITQACTQRPTIRLAHWPLPPTIQHLLHTRAPIRMLDSDLNTAL
jgi:hypothetical protein